jgi:hypothetical protein
MFPYQIALAASTAVPAGTSLSFATVLSQTQPAMLTVLGTTLAAPGLLRCRRKLN